MPDRTGIGSALERLDARRRCRLSENQAVEKEGKPGRKQRRADTGDVLADPEHDCEKRHQEAGEHSRRERGENPEPEAAAVIGGGESDHRAEEHDPLDAEIEHAGALRIELAGGGKDERCRNADQRGEEADIEDGEERIHQTIPSAVAGRITLSR